MTSLLAFVALRSSMMFVWSILVLWGVPSIVTALRWRPTDWIKIVLSVVGVPIVGYQLLALAQDKIATDQVRATFIALQAVAAVIAIVVKYLPDTPDANKRALLGAYAAIAVLSGIGGCVGWHG